MTSTPWRDPHRVVVYEPSLEGHRFHFASLIVDAFNELGLDVALATRAENFDSEEFRTFFRPESQSFSTISLVSANWGSRHLQAFHESRQIISAALKHQADSVIVPMANQFSGAVYLAARHLVRRYQVRVEGLHLGPGFGYDLDQGIRKVTFCFRRWLHQQTAFDRYYHLDSHQLDEVARGAPGDSRRFVSMPDPAPVPMQTTREEARHRLGLSPHGRVILVAGYQSFGKGVDRLVHAFANHLDRFHSQDYLLLAGKADNDVRNLLAGGPASLVAAGRIVLIDRHLSNDELDAAFVGSNVVVAVQRKRPGSSGNVVRAAAAHRLVVTRDQYWAGRVTRQFQLGYTTDCDDSVAFAESLLLACNQSEGYVISSQAARFIHYNSEENFKATWTSRTRELKGIPESESRVLLG